jgi:hypothetical protein
VSAAKKAAETAATQEAKGSTSINNAVIFNISGMPDWFEQESGLDPNKKPALANENAVLPGGMLTPPSKLALPDGN